MNDKDEIFNAFRCCITQQKCKGCPRDKTCKIVDSQKDYVEISKVLALDLIAFIKDKECLRRITYDGIRCGQCNRLLRYDSLFCDKCGRKIISNA